jgi:hypothetical protein
MGSDQLIEIGALVVIFAILLWMEWCRRHP